MKYLNDVVYGGVDGLLSAFNFLLIMQSASFPKHLILVIMVLKLLSDGVSLSLSKFSGSVTELEVRESLEEKTILTPESNPYASGLITLVGFLVFGSIPILIYHFVLHDIGNVAVSASIIISLLVAFGTIKSYVLRQDARVALERGVEFGVVGVVGVVASIVIGLMIHKIAGKHYV